MIETSNGTIIIRIGIRYKLGNIRELEIVIP